MPTLRFHITDAGRSASLFPDEVRDCTVRSLALALGWSYDRAHAVTEVHGRRYRRKFNVRKILDSDYFSRVMKGYLLSETHHPRMTVRRLLAIHPQITLIIQIKGHVLTVKNSTVYDECRNYVGAGSWVRKYWVVQEKFQDPENSS